MSDFQAIQEAYERDRRRMRFELQYAVFANDGCWEWTGTLYESGYGQFWWGKVAPRKYRNMKAHRASWLIYCGLIEGKAQVLHKCHNRKCVNYNHLYLGTHHQNMKDRDDAGRTSKWDHRYNFKRSPEMIERIMAEFKTGATVAQVCKTLGIGWQTVYRSREQSPELKELMAVTKTVRYSNANRQRKRAT